MSIGDVLEAAGIEADPDAVWRQVETAKLCYNYRCAYISGEVLEPSQEKLRLLGVDIINRSGKRGGRGRIPIRLLHIALSDLYFALKPKSELGQSSSSPHYLFVAGCLRILDLPALDPAQLKVLITQERRVRQKTALQPWQPPSPIPWFMPRIDFNDAGPQEDYP
jgi:hypothetical protein